MSHPLIAVVNDDTDFIELMEALLTEEGYNAIAIMEGDSAYRAIKKQKPDLVIIDIRLRDPDPGFATINLLRLDPQTATLPIIVCSTNTQLIQANKARLREKHCVVLMKPFGIEELYAKVADMLGPP